MSNLVPSGDDPAPIQVIDNPVNQQYEAVRDAKVVGFLSYRWTSATHVDLDHTYVAPRERGRNVGVLLVEHAIGAVRSGSAGLAPNCSFVSEYIAKHPEHADLVEPSTAPPHRRPGRAPFDVARLEAFVHDRHDVRLEPLQIVTSRVVLRPWDLEDTDVAYELFTHPSVARWMHPVVPPVRTRAEAANLLNTWILDSYQAPVPEGRWAIERQDSGQVIGSIFLTTATPASTPLTLWWHVRGEATGQGFATEAAHAAAHQAFTIGSADRIYALIDPANERAIAIAARIGMKADGTTDDFYDVTLNRYRLERDDLEQAQERRSLSLTD